MTSFEERIVVNVREAIRLAKRQGVVGMSVANLMQTTRPPSASLDGAPLGTNAPYYYREMFRRVVAGMKFRGFKIIH